MNFSEVPPLAHLGNLVAVGVIAAFILSVTFLPAMMMVLPVRVSQSQSSTTAAMEKLAQFVIDRQPLLWINVVIAAVFIALIPRNEINDEFVKYFDESMAFRTATDYAAAHLIGPYTIEYSLSSKSDNSEGSVANPDFLAQVDSFVTFLQQEPGVSHVYTLTDTFKRLTKICTAIMCSGTRYPPIANWPRNIYCSMSCRCLTGWI